MTETLIGGYRFVGDVSPEKIRHFLDSGIPNSGDESEISDLPSRVATFMSAHKEEARRVLEEISGTKGR